ncbi:SPFH domain-containing protein [Nocardiopsis sp. LOL_012]|uniref:SPFH domain-containing protein n=1 Tax=Nocardiopsis sp. LOL_012 TaxID=3345409 RepID=UPI003A837FAD
MTPIIIVALFVAVLLIIFWRSVRIVPHSMEDVVERFGKFHRTLQSGFNIVIPGVDSVRERVDRRVQVVSFPPQSAITEDNLAVEVDSAVYVRIVDAYRATYEVADFIRAVEQLTLATLRNVIGGMNLEDTLTSRDEINRELKTVLDEATSEWGIEISRIELKGIEPPSSVQEAMEMQMRADREKRAQLLSAEGEKQAAVLRAEGERSSAVLRAKGAAEAQMLTAKADADAQTLRARGEADAIHIVFKSLHASGVDRDVLAYQYLQKLPEIAKGDANKVWIVPSEMGQALHGVGSAFEELRQEVVRDI